MAAGFPHGFAEIAFFEKRGQGRQLLRHRFAQIDAERIRFAVRPLGQVARQMFGANDAVAGRHARPFDGIFELSDVSRPRRLEQDVHRFLRDLHGRSGPCEFLGEVRGENRDVDLPCPECGQFDADDVESIIEVFPELAFFDQLFEGTVGCRDDANVHFDGFAAPDPLESPFLEHAEELHLHRQGNVAHFVEEQRAPVGLFEATSALSHGPGERTFFVPEQLAFEERFGQGRAVDRHELAGASARGSLMQGSRDLLLARAGLAEDQHGRRRIGDVADQFEHLVHHGTFRQDIPKRPPIAQLFAEIKNFILKFPLLEGTLNEQGKMLRIGRLDQKVVRP